MLENPARFNHCLVARAYVNKKFFIHNGPEYLHLTGKLGEPDMSKMHYFESEFEAQRHLEALRAGLELDAHGYANLGSKIRITKTLSGWFAQEIMNDPIIVGRFLWDDLELRNGPFPENQCCQNIQELLHRINNHKDKVIEQLTAKKEYVMVIDIAKLDACKVVASINPGLGFYIESGTTALHKNNLFGNLYKSTILYFKTEPEAQRHLEALKCGLVLVDGHTQYKGFDIKYNIYNQWSTNKHTPQEYYNYSCDTLNMLLKLIDRHIANDCRFQDIQNFYTIYVPLLRPSQFIKSTYLWPLQLFKWNKLSMNLNKLFGWWA